MAINLLPWRQDKYCQSIKNRKRCFIFFTMLVLVFFMGVRHMLVLKLESIEKQNYLAGARFSMEERYENKRNKTIELIGFLSNLPLAVQDDLYVGKIAMRENLIKLIVYTDSLGSLEKFVESIKKQGGVGGVTIDSSATHGGSEPVDEKNKFIITLNMDKK